MGEQETVLVAMFFKSFLNKNVVDLWFDFVSSKDGDDT